MKSSSIFWGVFLIVAGAFFFVMQLDAFSIDYTYSKYLWPLIIVFIGISMFKIPIFLKNILAGLSGAILAFFIFGLFNHSWCFDDCDNWHFGRSDSERYVNNVQESITLDSTTTSAFLAVNGAIGGFTFSDTTSDLIYCNSNFTRSESDISDESPTRKIIRIDFDIARKVSKRKANSEVYLNPNIIWDIEFSAAATKVDADLSKYKVKTLDFSSAISSMDIRIGKRQDSVTINISSALSDLNISIPKEFACRISSDNALSKFDIDSFTQNGEFYTTENYGKAERVIFINLESGLSKIKVERE